MPLRGLDSGGSRAEPPYVRDTHYYLNFAAALSTCFDWNDAHIIVSANLMIDGNTSTRAEWNPLQKHGKTQWHAFGHATERYNELWYRVLDLILGGGSGVGGGVGGSSGRSAGASASTQKTLTVIVKFDQDKKVRDFAYHTSKF